MNRKLELKIRKKSLPQWLIWWMIVMPFLYYVLFDMLKLPHLLMYSLDVCWIALLVLIAFVNKTMKTREIQVFQIWTWVFLLCTAVVYFTKYQSIFYYLWGLRNNFRFYVFFIAVICFLKQKHIKGFLEMMDVVFWINAGLSLVQFYVFDQRGDYMGGVFGTTKGVNAYSIIFMTIVLSKSILMYLRYEEKGSVCMAKVAVALITVAHAELKVFFFNIILIFAMAVLIVRFSWRKLWIIVGGMAAIIVGTTLLGQIFGDGTNAWFRIDNLLELAFSERGYTARGDLSRLRAISQINDSVFSQWHEKMFGLGLGNCDVSSIALFRSPFSERYFWMNHTWFSMAMLYLETGHLGLIYYISFFVICFIKARKKYRQGNGLYCGMSMIMAVICCMLIPYNASLRTESAYMAYFILAIPFVGGKRENDEKQKNMLG